MNFHDGLSGEKIFFGLSEVINIKEIVRETFLIEISSSSQLAKSEPGQFVYIIPKMQKRTVLPRPLCIADADSETVKLIFKIRGKGTLCLSELGKGDKISVMGPLGTGFPLPREPVLLAGGGLGAAPLYFLAKKLRNNKKTSLLLGFKNSDEAYFIDEFKSIAKNVFVCTDDGSLGAGGNVVEKAGEIIKNEKVICACGPRPMLKGLSDFAGKKGLRIFVSLEERMGCGVGACLGCVVKIRRGGKEEYQRVCKEGPVFDGLEVVY
ncbi:MAG: dihydroorotate dehydrogenase electron transfer subunit [bacterium]|nr:dihydroorotate dehydrogenase electron transfer subunit [bacterium]